MSTENEELAEIDSSETDDSGEVVAQLPDPSWGSIQAAKTYPRSVKKFLAAAEAMATVSQDMAAMCMYTLPRGGKQITGPSVRLAEICASAWGNLDFGARIIREEDKYVVAMGFAHDLQMNTRCAFEIRRRITDKYGKRYNDDMITMTVNAAQSIALRNAIFRVVPKALVEIIYTAARKVAVGDQKTLGDRRLAMVDHFTKLGVSVERIAAAVNKPSVEDMDGEDLLTLRGLANALKDGAVSIDAAFPEPDAPAVNKLKGKLTDAKKGNNGTADGEKKTGDGLYAGGTEDRDVIRG